MAPNCHSADIPLRARTAVNLRMRGVMTIHMSCCPSGMGRVASQSPVVVFLGIGQVIYSSHDSGTSAPRRMDREACTMGPCTSSRDSAMRNVATLLDPVALPSATAYFTASFWAQGV